MNRKMNDDNWWKAIRTTVESDATPAVDDLWDVISPAVESALRRRRIGKVVLRTTLLGAAAALAVALLLPHRTAETHSSVLAKTALSEPVVKEIMPETASEDDVRTVPSKLVNVASKPVNVPAKPADAPSNSVNVLVPQSESHSDQYASASVEPQSTETSHLYLALDDAEPVRRRGRVRVSLSGSRESSGNNVTNVITEYSKICLSQGDNAVAVTSVATRQYISSDNYLQCQSEWTEAVRQDEMSISNKSELSSYRHLPPVTAKLAVSVDLTESLSVETGLSYTFLKSVITKRNDSYVEQLHFIGVPLSLRANVICGDRSSFYLSAGGQVDKCVKADFGYGNEPVAPLFWSATALLGYQYSLSSVVGLFVEAGGAFHFKNDYPRVTLYTDHPLQSSLQAGLRFELTNTK